MDNDIANDFINVLETIPYITYWHIQRAISQYNGSRRPMVNGYAYTYLGDVEISDVVDFAYSAELASEFLMCRHIDDDSYFNSYVEMEPDIYHYSFLGYSGSFMLQPSGNVLIMDSNTPSGNIDIRYNWEESLPLDRTSFTISFGDGYLYTFDFREMSHSFNSASGNDDENRSIGDWKLTRITAPNGRTAVFSYMSDPTVHQFSYQSGFNMDHTTMHHQGSNPEYLWQKENAPTHIVTVTNTVQPGYLQSVAISGGTEIEFLYEREGGISGQRAFMTGAQVRNSSGRIVRSCSMDAVSLSGSQVRFLKSLTIPGTGTWSMDYNGEDYAYLSAENMSWHTDWCGYYNAINFRDYLTYTSHSQMHSRAESLKNQRQGVPAMASLTMLSRITWPTGGWSVFGYEGNSYSYRSIIPGSNPQPVSETSTYGIRLRSIDNYDKDGSQMQRIEYSYCSSDGGSSGVLLREPCIYYDYSIGSEYLSFDRKVINTMSTLGFGKESHIVYDTVRETVSRDGSPLAEKSVTVYSYFSANEGPCNLLLANSRDNRWDYVNWDFGFSDYGSDWDVATSWSKGLYSGKLREVAQYKGDVSAANLVMKTINTYGSYVQKRVADESSAAGRNPTVEWPSVWMCSADKSTVVEPRSAYLLVSVTEEYDTSGNLLSRIPTYSSVDQLGRLSYRWTDYGNENHLKNVYQYLGLTPNVTSASLYRNNLLVSRKGYTYTQKIGVTGIYWRPASVTRTPSNNGTAGSVQTVTTFTQFDRYDNVTSSKDAMGNRTDYSWDATGQYLTSMTQYPDGTSSPGLTTRWDWIPLVGVTKVTHPGGKVERYGYDSCGRLVSVADSDGDTLARYDYHITADAADRSWMRTRSYRSAGEYADDITYFNGLGYPEQSNSVGAGGGSYDIITPYTYDALLRPEREWLPVPCETSGGEPDVDVSDIYFGDLTHWQLSWYQDWYGPVTECDEETVLARPFLKTISEFCPSGRPLSHTMAGPGYGEHPTSFSYLADTIDCRAVRGVRTTDGDGRVSIEWKDYEDRIVAFDRYQYDSLSVACGDTLARTLYRYDWRGNLTQVVTPEGNSYHYTYDALSRVISKTIPGREPETYTYDALDRMVTSQDGNQRDNGITIHYSYDDIGRLLSKEVVKNGKSRPMVTYDYDRTTGLKTGENAYLVIDDGLVHEEDYLSRSFTYDNEERLSSMSEVEYENQYSFDIEFGYDLAGNEVSRREEIVTWDATTIIQTTRSYDSRSRLTGEAVSVNDVQKSSVSIAYDELGRPCRTTYGSGSNAITESTTYTIQGWTESKWSDLLRQNWHYENSSLPSWTGNITRWDWRHLAAAGETDSSGNAASYQQRSELFSYDGLNRLSGSAMTIGTGATATSDSRWSERNIRYDLEGNILHLERYQGNANTPQATLDFSYDGPKRNGYSYDSNGNITYDPLRCFEIRYNLLNLAAEVIGHDPEDTAAEGTLLCETVYYADGTRSGVRRPNDGPWLTRYVSSLICDGDSEFLYPMGVVSDFGYIDLQSGKMQYFLRDHLGSVRVIAEDRHTVISRTDYLPFGVRMSGDGLTGANSTARSSFFGFSGKENEMWGGYDTADGDITPHWLKGERYQHFGARAYDPVSCIFMQVDPMAEKYYGMTPYGYCAGNPVMMVDPDGNFPETLWDIANVVLDFTSLVSNIKQGNSKAAIADGAGLVLDVAATIIPVIPGGAGTALKAARGADKAADVVKATDNAVDATKIVDNAEKTIDVAKPYSKSRPSYAKGQVNEVWETAKNNEGVVRDPHTQKELQWDANSPRSWDMGHIEGQKYSDVHKKYMNGEMSKEEFLDWYHDPKNYKPEDPVTNRGHKFE